MADVTARQLCPQAECLIAAGLESRILIPGEDLYAARIDSYWCNSAKLQPACIVQPNSTSQVATIIKALSGAQQIFAIRSGGHTNWAGSNNINGGVTIDLGLISSVMYDAVTETADIGPGAKWKHVYEELEKHGRVVAGGREAEVGVGGLLLGGGNTFYTGRHGLACDNVVGYEVVLASGDIVTADADGTHADLFRALKGGSNNFGVVTRFTMRTLPITPLWGGFSVKPADVMPEAAEAFAIFTKNSYEDPDSTINLSLVYMPRFGGNALVVICTNVAGIEEPPAMKQFSALPTVMNNLKKSSMQELISYTSLPINFYNIWYTLTFKNDASIIKKASELHFQLAAEVREKISDGDFTTHCSFQPIPKAFIQTNKIAGNVLGLEKYAFDAILIQINASVRTQELADWVRPKVRGMMESVRVFAESIEGGVCPWLHLNYASPDQPVLSSYGAENVSFMREVAQKYDADGIFQRLCPGGFKISAVTD